MHMEAQNEVMSIPTSTELLSAFQIDAKTANDEKLCWSCAVTALCSPHAWSRTPLLSGPNVPCKATHALMSSEDINIGYVFP
jgi:hypothetical protein